MYTYAISLILIFIFSLILLSIKVELVNLKNWLISGVGIDITKNLLFVSDASGSVYKASLSHKFSPIPILTPSLITYSPLDLSVDWLNAHLYILGEVKHNNDHSKWEGSNFVHWQLVRCDFDGRAQTIAFAGFHSKPVHIEVNPYNGCVIKHIFHK